MPDTGGISLLSSASATDENPQRGNWGNKVDFLLSCLGYAVGLGNVWRFPYLAYDNGGGAFLVPYFVMLMFAGLPLFFLEVSFGQYASEGPISVWKSLPMMRGIGYGMMIVSAYVGIYYNVIIMYTIYYLFASFTKVLPWTTCNNDWNTLNCSSLVSECLERNITSIIINNGSCVPVDYLDVHERREHNIEGENGDYNVSNYRDPLASIRVRPSEEYFRRSVLRESDSIGELVTINWRLALCLLLAWVIVFFCLIKGIKSSGKVVYVTATFPYIVLTIFLILGLTLPGHEEGIRFFITPKWGDIANPKVWLDAAIQIFFSLSAAWGGLITLSSYNKFHNNCYVDSLFVAIGNCATSVFAGFVIFSIVGFMAHELDRPVGEVVAQGFSLAFVAYPEAVSLLPVAPLWSILFFLMLLTLGLDSQFTIIETIVTAIVDEFPDTLRKIKILVLSSVCVIGYLLGLICVTNSGPYWVNLMDSYGASFALLLFAVFECIGLSWLYGVKRFKNDIRSMIGDGWVDFPLFWFWPLCWCCITPALLSFVLLFNWFSWSSPTYNGDYPFWAHIIGWLMIGFSIMWIPLVWVYEFLRCPGGLARRWRAMSNPRSSWGPALQQFREEAWRVHAKHGTTMGGQLDAGIVARPNAHVEAAIEPNGFSLKEKDNSGYEEPL